MDVANSVSDAVYRLGFVDSSEITSASWVTNAELYQFADDAAKRLAYQVGAFVGYDASITVSAGTAIYNLPASHVFTLQTRFTYAGGAQLLRITRVEDLWALDGAWDQTRGFPLRASMDAGSVGTVTLYPNPSVGGTLAQICQEYVSIAQGNSTVQLPPVLQDYFTYVLLGESRGKESEGAMPEMADHFRQRARMYEQVMDHLFGPGQ